MTTKAWKFTQHGKSLWVSQVKINQKILRKIVDIFLPINFNVGFWCSKDPSQWDGSFEYPQHMFWLRNKKNNFLVHTLNLRASWKISYYIYVIMYALNVVTLKK